MRRAKIAKEKEVLQVLTEIMRKEKDAKTSETLKAAELLGKYYGAFSAKSGKSEACNVYIVDDVPKTDEKSDKS